ncbi:MAG TPA: hypothetical protein VK668_07120 [Mucilaginibacter sp.]|nr:hypothetical protein [Mucilaginibacter sp.]
MKKNIINISLAIFLALICNNLFAQATDFSGKWQINKTKTDFDHLPESVIPQIYIVSRGKETIVIERKTIDTSRNEHKSIDSLSFSGKVMTAILYNGTRRTVTLKWADNEHIFLITATSVYKDGNPGPKYIDAWSLADNGKTLIVDRHVDQSDGSTYSLKAYYDKQ